MIGKSNFEFAELWKIVQDAKQILKVTKHLKEGWIKKITKHHKNLCNFLLNAFLS